MAAHLSPTDIRRLSADKLTGTDFAEALIHIEACDECRKLLPPLTKAEIIRRLLAEDLPPGDKIKPAPDTIN